ncbi:MAG: DoxX family membrane protein [Alphaproteobacteria bacterium]|nr:DoxX family membrane protein [Alphaproteobacteria bacterium]
MRALYASFARLCDAIPYALLALVCRVAAAVPFWRSGQAKLDGADFLGVKFELFHLKASQAYLFAEEFHFPETIAPAAAQLAAIGENILSPLLIIGLFGRASALGLLVMTAVIQFYVYPSELLNPNGNWSEHLLWAAPLLVVLGRGPGGLSADAWARTFFSGRR